MRMAWAEANVDSNPDAVRRSPCDFHEHPEIVRCVSFFFVLEVKPLADIMCKTSLLCPNCADSDLTGKRTMPRIRFCGIGSDALQIERCFSNITIHIFISSSDDDVKTLTRRGVRS